LLHKDTGKYHQIKNQRKSQTALAAWTRASLAAIFSFSCTHKHIQ